MAKKTRVIVLRTAGTNCDKETANAFEYFGARVDCVHINQLFRKEYSLDAYHILAIPGGFTYGDDIESGRVLANEMKVHLAEDLIRFVRDGKLMIGICNGFQVLVKAGLLPGTMDSGNLIDGKFTQNATLTCNDSGKFEDRWTFLKVSGQSVWTKNLGKIVYLPVAHAEGKFMTMDDRVLKKLTENGQVAFRYCTQDGEMPAYPQNPNGAVDHIAGVTDVTGRILGLMPHPERHFYFENHPFWTAQKRTGDLGDGAKIFENGIVYVKANL